MSGGHGEASPVAQVTLMAGTSAMPRHFIDKVQFVVATSTHDSFIY
jgi:hypothetical protein